MSEFPKLKAWGKNFIFKLPKDVKSLSTRHNIWCPALRRVTIIEKWLNILRGFLRTNYELKSGQLWTWREFDISNLIKWHFVKMKHLANSKPSHLHFSLDNYENRWLWMHSYFHSSIRNQFIEMLGITDSVPWQLFWKIKF